MAFITKRFFIKLSGVSLISILSGFLVYDCHINKYNFYLQLKDLFDPLFKEISTESTLDDIYHELLKKNVINGANKIDFDKISELAENDKFSCLQK